MATPIWQRQMRPVHLWDATWMVLDHPTSVVPIIDMVQSWGYSYPATDTVTCADGHTWRNLRDRHGRWQLPNEVRLRHRVEVFDPDLGDTIGYDPYWVCHCGAEVPVRWAHTGPIVFPIQMGEELSPNNTIQLRFLDKPGGFRVDTTLAGTYPLLDADGNTVCEIAPQGMSVSDAWDRGDISLPDPPRVMPRTRYVLEAAIISPPREALTALLQAVYGEAG